MQTLETPETYCPLLDAEPKLTSRDGKTTRNISLFYLKYSQLSSSQRFQFVGFSIVFLSILLGCTTKRNPDLPPTSGYVSNIIGYIFLLAWSLSFYPQILLNW
jgi:hypothetical protein